MKKENVRFEVNEDAEIVVAISYNDSESLVRYVGKQLGLSADAIDDYIYAYRMDIKNLLMTETLCLDKLFITDTHKGIVRCHGGDKFDIETGKEEALKKLRKNIARAKEKALKRWQTAMNCKIGSVNISTAAEASAEALKKINK
jgi:hypothetical protein